MQLSNQRRALTLVELLCAVACVALAIALLAPTLRAHRDASMGGASLDALRRHAQRIFAYTHANREEWVNPFDSVPLPGQTAVRGWLWAKPPPRGFPFGWYGWNYETGGTEPFGWFWLDHLLYLDRVDRSDRQKQCIAPGDAELIRYARAIQTWDRENILQTSYWYPPTFWQNADRFTSHVPLAPSVSNQFLVRRNKVHDALNPARKVLLFECKDFTAGHMWLWPQARPHVARADGSAARIEIASVIAGTPSPFSPDESAAGLRFPSGVFHNQGYQLMNAYLYGNFNPTLPQTTFNWEYLNPGQSIQPAYFWRTRHGLRGADLPR